MALNDVKFAVVITFDIKAKGNSGTYKEVSEYLEKKGFVKEKSSGDPFPENIYFGAVNRKVETSEDNMILVRDLKAASSQIRQEVYELLDDYFDFKRVSHKLFIHVSRFESSSTSSD